MSYLDNKREALQYIKICEGITNLEVIEKLKIHLKKDSTLLELESGLSYDLNILKDYYNVTGSNRCKNLLDICREKHNDIELLLLDALTLKTSNKYDCIYSNKALQYLRREQLYDSIIRQSKIIKEDGIIFHTFWRGELEHIYGKFNFTYYEKEELMYMFEDIFEIIDINYYSDIDEDDSVYIVCKNNKKRS